MSVRLEFQPQDCWIGVYWCKSLVIAARNKRRRRRDIWICIIPMLPIHIWWLKAPESEAST